MEKQRSNFSNKIGFVLAAAGSAVGLGNIWRFPYLAAKYGGGIFLLVYFILLVTFGFSLMIAEIAIGRKTKLSAVKAYGALDKRFGFVGTLTSFVPIIIFPYYCVIGGWVVKYFFAFITGEAGATAQNGYFEKFIGQTGEPIIWLLLFMIITAAIVMCGVEKGIESSSKVLMPILVLLSVIVAVFTITMPGAWDGVLYYLTPDFSKFSIKTVLGAVGQLFYSMSLAMGIMITYGSYMKKEVDLESSTKKIELFDAGISFIAGLMIVPAVFVFSGGDESAMNAGAGLMFITLPKVFAAMKMGTVIGGVFFLLVLFAALTSAISLMETIVSILQDKFKWNRIKATIIVLIGSMVIALPSTLGFGAWSGITPLGLSLLDFFDFISNSVIMPVVAFCTCIFVGYFIKPKTISDEVKISSAFKRENLFVIVIKYIAPICLIAILISYVMMGLGLISI